MFANALFRGLAGLVNTPATTKAKMFSFPPIAVMDNNKFKVDGELTYAIGEITNHKNVGFTPYLDKNVCKLQGPLPLKIFNKKWQQKAIA